MSSHPATGPPSSSDSSSDETRFKGEIWPLLPAYSVPDGHFDELLTGSRVLRPFWEEFAAATGDLNVDYFAQAQKRVARQIDENGVTYNVYATADGPGRPWTLDVLPLLIPTPEWDLLGRGLRQRARLLNAVAADLYGAQTLLHEGLIPPALVFRHPGFLRECHGVTPADGVFLHLVAFDLARGPNGRWRVVGTRTQAPSGVGYALENRAIMSRVFPDAFRAMRAHALSPFFQALREMLLAGAPVQGESPHVVLLTPGPYNETYFEHAYLARQLGFPLVEGRRSHRPARSRVLEDRLRAASRPRDSPASGRRLLRPVGVAAGIDAGHSGSGSGVARGPRARRERLRHGRARVAGAARVPAADLPASARRDARDAGAARPGGAAKRRRSRTPVGVWRKA